MTVWAEDDVEAALSGLDAESFTSHLVLDRTPWLWADRASYVDWKSELAIALGVDPYSLLVVGSAATGVTLNPRKELFRPFAPESDVDVAVISHYHFELAWKTIRELGKSGSIPTKSERRARSQHRSHLVFDGTIAADWILEHLPFGEAWSGALLAASRSLPQPDHEVKARIYRDVDALRNYQLRNIRRLKDSVLAGGSDVDVEGEPLATVDEEIVEGLGSDVG